MSGFLIGDVLVDPPVVLAPMAGITDRAFRGIVRRLGGCGLTVTEFVSSESLSRGVEQAWRMAELDPDEHPVSIQIYGRDPERMAVSARHCEALGADLIDINLGCPSKRVTSGRAGSALMREPELARDIFSAVFDAISVPMTVKMRLGWDPDELNAPEIAAAAAAAGARMVAVHARTRMCRFKGDADWDAVRAVRDAVSVPLLVNGDIVDPATARAALEASGADGVMIGRAVMRDPWTLARIAADLAGGRFVEPVADERRRFVHDYLDRLGDEGPLGQRSLAKLRKVLGYFSKGMYDASRFRRELHEVDTVSGARSVIDAFFASQVPFSVAPPVGRLSRRPGGSS